MLPTLTVLPLLPPELMAPMTTMPPSALEVARAAVRSWRQVPCGVGCYCFCSRYCCYCCYCGCSRCCCCGYCYGCCYCLRFRCRRCYCGSCCYCCSRCCYCC